MRRRLSLIAIMLITLSTTAVAPVASTSAVGQTADAVSDTDTADDRVIYQFEQSDVELLSVTVSDGSTYATLRSESGERIAINEGDLSSTGSFERKTVEIDGRTQVELPVETDAVAVVTSQDGYFYQIESDGALSEAVTLQSGLVIGGLTMLIGVGMAAYRKRTKSGDEPDRDPFDDGGVF
jgi:hypothetical protein